MSSSVGYTGGTTDSPTYREVCDQEDASGHTEAVRIVYKPDVLSFETICRRILEEATLGIRRCQYQSALWAQNAEQAATAKRIAVELGKESFPIFAAAPFHDAEARHQKYYEAQCAIRSNL